MRKELIALREVMKNYGIDIYIVPTGDFHGSEYLHDYFKTRRYVSGFTGSAGTLVVAQDEARLWTDGRYFLQAAMELEGSGILLMKDKEPGVPDIKDYIKDKLMQIASNKTNPRKNGSVSSHLDLAETGPTLGFNGKTLPFDAGEEYEKMASEVGGKLVSDFDLVGEIWADRPALTGKTVWQLPLSSAGLPFETKIKQVRELMKKAGADYHLITTLDDNAWLFNLRGSDVEHTPVFFSYTLITPDETILYLFKDMCPSEIIPEGVQVKNYFSESDGEGPDNDILSVCLDVERIPEGATLLLDGKTVPYTITDIVPENVNLLMADVIPSSRLKAIKNEVEIESTKEAHVNDGIAMVNFIHWLKSSIVVNEQMTEISVSDYLENQRRALPGFLDLSFETIAGYMEHGAIVHYSASPESDAMLRPEGFILVDSGGQYETGTTDITRTIALGPLSKKMKEAYTVVLKGHAQLAMAKFCDGTKGIELDKIVKSTMDEYGISYNHGTGHGVGHVLCVHEGPQRINTICEEPLIPGMITSNEPGYYPEGEFGVRIENEILCVPCDCCDDAKNCCADETTSSAKCYCFENLTCCPYERDAIVKEMLTKEEIEYVNNYHAWVLKSLESKVTTEAEAWLRDVCAPL